MSFTLFCTGFRTSLSIFPCVLLSPGMYSELQAHIGTWPCSGFPPLLFDTIFKLQKDTKRAWADFHQS